MIGEIDEISLSFSIKILDVRDGFVRVQTKCRQSADRADGFDFV